MIELMNDKTIKEFSIMQIIVIHFMITVQILTTEYSFIVIDYTIVATTFFLDTTTTPTS